MEPYGQYLHWAVYVGAAIGVWRYLPLWLVRLVAAFTNSDQRRRQCLEVLRLARKDAASLPSYLPSEPSSPPQPAATKVVQGRARLGFLATLRRAFGG